MSIGVVIPVCIPSSQLEPRFGHLQRVVLEVLHQLGPLDCCIVADDGSAPAVRDYLSAVEAANQRRFSVQFRPQEDGAPARPWRVASSRNLGASRVEIYTRPEAFVFLDADCLPGCVWFEAFRRFLAIDGGLSKADVVFGKIDAQTGHGDEIQKDLRSPNRMGGARRLACLFERGGGGNLFVTRDHFRGAGGFDETYDGGFGWEETDFAVRAYEMGAEVLYSDDAAVTHLWHPRGKEHFLNIERNRALFQSQTRLFAGGRA